MVTKKNYIKTLKKAKNKPYKKGVECTKYSKWLQLKNNDLNNIGTIISKINHQR